MRTNLLVIFIGLLGVVALIYGTSDALSKPHAPPVSWAPDHLVVDLMPGESAEVAVTATIKQMIPSTSVTLTPSLDAFFSVAPVVIPSLAGGTAQVLTLALTIPESTAFQTIEGTLHLREGERTIAKPLPITLNIPVVPLPPDPGDAGTVTLEGIDSDNDGVRDDIQRYITLTYPNSASTRAALTQWVVAAQDTIRDAHGEEASIAHALERIRAQDCLRYVLGLDAASGSRKQLRAEFLNTKARSLAWVNADGHLGGQVYRITPMSQRRFHCNFDPDSTEE